MKSYSLPKGSPRATRRMLPRAPRNWPVPTGDGERRVGGVEERPLDGDRADLEGRHPPALPAHAHLDADALALVAADHGLVVLVEDLVVERQQVAGRVAVRREVDRRVGRRVLDHVHPQDVRTGDRRGH